MQIASLGTKSGANSKTVANVKQSRI